MSPRVPPLARDAAMSRRVFLVAGGGAVVAAAMANTTRAGASILLHEAHDHGKGGKKGRKLSALLVSSDLYASPDPQRVGFVVARGLRFVAGPPAEVGFAPPGSNRGTTMATVLYETGLPDGRGVYVAEPIFSEPGVRQGVVITRGKELPLAVEVREAARAPVVGAPAPRDASPTLADTLGVKPICTRRPKCPLHDVSLADVIGTGKPVAVIFATPALCTSRYCGPVLDEVLDVMGRYQDRVAFVHVEIYADKRGVRLAPTVDAWGLPSEPWLFAVDRGGTIRARLDGAFGQDEVTSVLDALVA